MTIKGTYKIAMAAGQDAGNRSMKAAGRTEWNEEDWGAATAARARLFAGGAVMSKEEKYEAALLKIMTSQNLGVAAIKLIAADALETERVEALVQKAKEVK